MFPHSRTSCRVHKAGLFIAEGISRYRKLRGYLRFSKAASLSNFIIKHPHIRLMLKTRVYILVSNI